MKEKLLYTAPEAELLVVRFEANIMSGGAPGAAGGNMIPGNTYGFGDDD